MVNTCGFIDAAREESVDTILEMAQFKSEGACEKLVVTGCLNQRYPEELAREIPEIDHMLGSADYANFHQVIERAPEARGRGRRRELPVVEVLATRTVMKTRDARRALAREVLALGERLVSRSGR